MRMMSRFATLALTAAILFAVSACDDDPLEEVIPAESKLVEDLAADPTTGRDPVTGAPIATGRYTLYSLETGMVISSATAHSPDDSASAKWDIGFRGTDIIVNGGSNGPGDGGIIVQSGIFEELAEAPKDGYVTEVPGGSGNGWYNYAGPPSHVISPVPGRFLIIRTGTAKYAKVKILNYYEGAPDYSDPGFNAFDEQDRHYTFEYVYQPDGMFDAE
jgi:hypothetical protein